MAMTLRHPGRRRLERWLEGTAGARVERHVERCERCANRLLAGADDSADRMLTSALRSVLAPEDGYADRMTSGATRVIGEPSLVALFADLYRSGVTTVDLLVREEDPNDG
jgi:hypothetical protein